MSELPARVTTPLLTLLTQQSLDEDYEVVAQQERRARQADPDGDAGARGARHQVWIGSMVVAVVFGLLLALAGVQTARNAGVASAGRDQLITRINDRREVVADQRTRIADLRAANRQAREEYRAQGRLVTTTELRRQNLGESTGFSPVSGAGVRMVVRDSADGSRSGQVRDADLSLLTNGLWRQGARAIAVNGERLTALSAFRNSSEVIRINGTSLSPPYVVEVISPNDSITAKFMNSDSGARFTQLINAAGLGFTVQNVSQLELPSAPARLLHLREAEALTTSTKSEEKQ